MKSSRHNVPKLLCASGLLMICLLAGPRVIHAAQFGDFAYDVNAGQITITDYTGPGGDLLIPGSIEGHDVTSIGGWAFSGCTGLTSISIPDGVTVIEGGAFYFCTNLTSVTIPDSVRSIQSVPGGKGSPPIGAFEGCTALASIYFEGSLPEIDYGAFDYSDNVLLYYRPATSDRTGTVAGRPTALWIPLTLGDQPLTTERLRLHSSSPAPAILRVQRSVNLRDWEDWQTVSRDEGPGELYDSEADTVPYRFYRLVEQ